MYADEVPRLSDWARDDPDNLADLCTFVVLTIRVTFARVAGAFKDVQRKGEDSAYLWGAKRQAYKDIHADPETLHADLFDANVMDTIDILATRVHGLGIVKSAFIAQMLGHDVACMDVRNITDAGLPERSWRTDGKQWHKLRPATRERKIAEYVQFTIETGGAEHWWNHWCHGIAPQFGGNADRVSKLHWSIPTGRRK
jgi:hypothetical protein